MNIQLNAIDILKQVAEAPKNEIPQWKIDLIDARLEIINALLVYSYHALGLVPPSDEIIAIRSAQISERADICNNMMKDAFLKALDIKMAKDLRTPITYGDISRAAILISEERGISIVGMYKKALPKIEDKELWGEKVCLFASTYAKNEFTDMMRISHGI